jgi:ketopantoate reductase
MEFNLVLVTVRTLQSAHRLKWGKALSGPVINSTQNGATSAESLTGHHFLVFFTVSTK